MAQTARIVGKVEYREGDGPNIAIRPGPVEVAQGLNDVTLSWVDEETHAWRRCPWPISSATWPKQIRLDA
ncbi:hypothetical protein Y695_04664 [Hydrogenophaga sp. T4]|nr:hypothetical protein Y695_04664 [Hydrogenophaga sp. T4]